MDRLVFPMATHNYFHTPLWLAAHCGYFAELGLEIVFRHIPTGTDELAAAVKSGVGQISSSTIERVIIDRERGGRLIAIGGKVNRLPFSLIARPSIKNFSDLRGATIGVSSLSNGTSTLIVRLCETHGLRYPQDFVLRAVGPIEKRWELLRSGEIDAGLQGIPYNLIAIDSGFTQLAEPADLFSEYQFSCFIVDEDWARDHRDIIERFLLAILRALDKFHNDREIATSVAMQASGLTENYAQRAWELYTTAKIFPRDGDISVSGLKSVAELSAAVRDVEKRGKTQVKDCVDRSYLLAACRQFSAINMA
jgi:ABC-type nitrate/sulfonate/bicarbonate transport system substrate-binding protein